MTRHRTARWTALLLVAALVGAGVASTDSAVPGQSVIARIVTGPSRLVSSDEPDVDHAEPWLAVDPGDPTRAVTAVIAANGDRSVVYATVDGGTGWRRGFLAGELATVFPGGDPMVAFDGDGNVFLATISPFRVWRSRNGGLTWQGPSLVPGRSFDREYLAARSVPGAPDTIYAMAKTPIKIFGHLASDVLALSRSIDQGQTFEAPRLVLPDPTKSIVHVAGGLVVTPVGEILVSFLGHDVPVTDPATLKNHIWVMRSRDGGRSFDEPVSVAESVVYGNSGDELKMLKSLAGARLVMDTATGSPFRGRLYVSFLTVLDDRLQVLVVTSSDTGRSWGRPIKVNDDAGRANHSNPEIAVGARGVVAVMWNDRRADPNDLCYRATVSASVDGGASFLPNVAVEPSSTCPVGADPTSLQRSGFNWRYLQGGETQGLVGLPGGKFLAVYLGGQAKVQVRATTITIVGK